MDMRQVNSTNISHVGYDQATRTMRLRFVAGNNAAPREYDYHGVSPEQHKALLNAHSIGRHFNAHIKENHRTTRVGA